ncbi:hypothetical protein, partial [Serratia liquefaciens]|uniref:hypothetical protein n=1 Tax=Serratia liquefaciens TaxID=614 RepID=UPI00235F33BB
REGFILASGLLVRARARPRLLIQWDGARQRQIEWQGDADMDYRPDLAGDAPAVFRREPGRERPTDCAGETCDQGDAG